MSDPLLRHLHRMMETAEVVPSQASVLGGTVLKGGAGYLAISQVGAVMIWGEAARA